ncbi:MAG: protein kinase [bacterium]|nr:protein kinase [bacterium]
MEYQTASPVGSGGISEVFKAWDPRLERFVALKYLRHDDPRLVERLLREARAQARIRHPNICQVYEVGDEDGRPFIAMQFIEGPPFDLAAETMSLEEKVQVLKTVVEAVHEAHSLGVVHRDLKPGNILVEESPEGGWHPYLVDFGLAQEHEAPRLTRTGEVMGTPAFMAPEQARGETDRTDRRTDVYALGATLHTLVAGRPPFQGDSSIAVLLQVVDAEPPPLRRLDASIPADLEAIVLKCLEKEPQRRYDSARALAEDLGRWLSGEAVTAQRVTWGRRLLRRARRHPLQAAVVGGFVLVLILLAAANVRSRQAARMAAELAQRFGRQVEWIDARIRYSYLAPLHDVRPELDEIRRMTASLAEHMAELGPIAQAPGHFALGRAYLTLGDLEEARQHLEQAKSAGYVGPDLAHALGVTYALLYRDQMHRAAGLTDPELRERARERARQELKEPALAHFRRAEVEDSAEAGLVQGLMAFFEQRYDQAIAKGRIAIQISPLLYEAERLQGDAALAKASASIDSGAYEEGRELLERAGASYRRAQGIARSDPSVYEAECERLRRTAELDVLTGQPSDVHFQAAISSCEKALVADDARASAHRLLSLAHTQLGNDLWWNRGADPGAAFHAALTHVARATELAPEDPGGHSALGLVHLTAGRHRLERGEEASAQLQAAVDAFRRAISLDPGSTSDLVKVGMAHLSLGLQEDRRGRDPRPNYDQAVEANRQAIGLESELLPAWVGLGQALTRKAEYEMAVGIDPRESFQGALESFRRASEINPRSPSLLNNAGLAAWILGDYERLLREDPEGSLDKAEESFRAALEIKPDQISARVNLAGVHYSRAQFQLLTGRDPRSELTEARREIFRVLELHPDDFYLDRGEYDLLEAQWLMSAGASPEALLEQAVVCLGQGIARFPGRADEHRALAQVHLERGRWRFERGQDPSGDLDAGRIAAQKAIDLDADLALAHAARGALDLLAAQSSSDPAAAAAAAANAAQSLRRAVTIDPLLAADQEPLVREAEALSHRPLRRPGRRPRNGG